MKKQYLKIKFTLQGLLYGVINFWRFRKEIFGFRPWDFEYNMDLFNKSLEKTEHYLESKGHQTEAREIKEFLDEIDFDDNYLPPMFRMVSRLRGWWD